MNTNKLSQHLILLGFCALGFYGFMFATGKLPIEVMPQFLVSAVVFMSSGHYMRKAAKTLARQQSEEDETEEKERKELDWPWLTGLLNWTGAFLVIGIMAILLMKPIGLSFSDALQFTVAPEQFFSHTIP